MKLNPQNRTRLPGRSPGWSLQRPPVAVEAAAPMLVLLALLLTGCETPSPVKTPASQPTTVPTSLTVTIKQIGNGDPQPAPNSMIRLVIFMLDMPPGSVSGNTDFWKRVDEQSVGAAEHDRLLRNGIRCGIVPQSESLFYSQFFDRRPHTLSISHVEGSHEEAFELQMEKHFDRENLFFFNADNEVEGRSYEHGINQLTLSFSPAARDDHAVRLSLCPVVKSEKTRMGFTPLNEEFETPMKEVDRLYDLGLSAQVPEGSFFIIAPSSDAQRESSIGGSFLIKHDKTEKLEQVIVIVPTFLRLDGTPMIVRDPMFK
jgi:hypothetical protein